MGRTRTRVIIGAGVLVLAAAAFVLWFMFIRDTSAKKLDPTDLDKALATTTIAGEPAATAAGAPPPAASTPGSSTAAASGVDGTWTVTSDSTLGYRVKEVLAGLDKEATGRTNLVKGTLTIAGTRVTAVDLTVDVDSITSDDGRRDGQFRERIMDVSRFPEATFQLTAPIELGSIPAEGATITVPATGDLTLKGTTRSVTFDLQAKLENGRIGALGNIPVHFSDYGIDNPSNAIAKVGDDGLLEFVLVFAR